MKVLIINTVCKEGSTGKIAYKFHEYLKEKGHQSKLCYGRGATYPRERDLIKIDLAAESFFHILLTRLTGMQGSFSNFATNKLLKIIKDYKPDAVYLLNLHGYYINEFRVLEFLKKFNAHVLYFMPDEYPFTGTCCYSYECDKYKIICGSCTKIKEYPKSLFFDSSKKTFKKKAKIYNEFNNIIFASPAYVINKAKKSALLKDKNMVEIDTGVDIENMFYPRNAEELRNELKIPLENKIILNVAPFSNERKGVKYFLEAAKILVDEKITFINIGFDVDKIICPKNFIPIDYVSDQNELATYYSMADLLVCTSIADAMPNVCLDALGCGTPICGFDISGTPYVASKEFGEFVKPYDVEAIANAINKTPIKTKNRIDSCRKYAQGRYSNKIFFEKSLYYLKNIGGEKYD